MRVFRCSVHVCVCVCEGPGLMPCCHRAPDDEVVKPQEDGRNKKKLREKIQMKNRQNIRAKKFLSFTEKY